MGWLQLIGSIKSHVSFAKEPYKRDDILHNTYNFIDPTYRGHPMGFLHCQVAFEKEPYFAKERHKRHNILYKRNVISSTLLTVATP